MVPLNLWISPPVTGGSHKDNDEESCSMPWRHHVQTQGITCCRLFSPSIGCLQQWVGIHKGTRFHTENGRHAGRNYSEVTNVPYNSGKETIVRWRMFPTTQGKSWRISGECYPDVISYFVIYDFAINTGTHFSIAWLQIILVLRLTSPTTTMSGPEFHLAVNIRKCSSTKCQCLNKNVLPHLLLWDGFSSRFIQVELFMNNIIVLNNEQEYYKEACCPPRSWCGRHTIVWLFRQSHCVWQK